jgi:hypothetical protein
VSDDAKHGDHRFISTEQRFLDKNSRIMFLFVCNAIKKKKDKKREKLSAKDELKNLLVV